MTTKQSPSPLTELLSNVDNANKLAELVTVAYEAKDLEALKAIANHEKVSATILRNLSELENVKNVEKLHLQMAYNEKLTLRTQQLIFDTYFGKYHQFSPIFSLTRNPKLKPEIVTQLIETDNKEILRSIVSVSKYLPLIADRLFERMFIEKTLPKDSHYVRSIASVNNLNPEYVNFFVNNYANSDILFEITRNRPEDNWFPGDLAGNRSLTSTQVTKIFNSYINVEFDNEGYDANGFDVRYILERVARYGNCSPEVFESLAKKGDNEIWLYLFENPNTPTFALRMILGYHKKLSSHSVSTLLPLVNHHNMTTEMLKEILNVTKSVKLVNTVVNEMFFRGEFSDWPAEWVEAKYGVKLDAKRLKKMNHI